MHFDWWIAKAAGTHSLCNTCCFSMAAVVTQMCFTVTLYAHCKSCYRRLVLYCGTVRSRKSWNYPLSRMWISEEALTGINIMYRDQNTDSCFLEREMTLLQAYLLPPTTQAITTHFTHTMSYNQAAIRLWIDCHVGFMVISMEWIWFGSLTIISNPSYCIKLICYIIIFYTKVFCCPEVQGIM